MEALLIKLIYIWDLVAVIVTVADQHTLAVQHLDIAVHITDPEFYGAAVGLDDPTERAEFENGIHHAGDLGDHIKLLKASLDGRP